MSTAGISPITENHFSLVKPLLTPERKTWPVKSAGRTGFTWEEFHGTSKWCDDDWECNINNSKAVNSPGDGLSQSLTIDIWSEPGSSLHNGFILNVLAIGSDADGCWCEHRWICSCSLDLRRGSGQNQHFAVVVNNTIVGPGKPERGQQRLMEAAYEPAITTNTNTSCTDREDCRKPRSL